MRRRDACAPDGRRLSPLGYFMRRRDAKLLGGRPDRDTRDVFGDALHLVEDASGPDDRDPELRVALPLAHARLGRLLGHGLVREHADPDFAAPLQAPRERDTGRLDLPVGHPARLEGLEAVVAEGQGRAALRLALPPAPLGLAVP